MKTPPRKNNRSSVVAAAAVFGVALTAVLMWYGAFLPYGKATRYIAAQGQSGEIRNVEQFENIFRVPLDFASPTGGEEIPKFIVGDIIDLVSRVEDEAVAKRLTAFIEPYLWEDEVRHLLFRGQLHYILWRRFGGEADVRAAEDAYRRAHEIGPHLPQPLLALHDIYSRQGDPRAAEIKNELLRLWPDANIDVSAGEDAAPTSRRATTAAE